jgi:hypothetical protein
MKELEDMMATAIRERNEAREQRDRMRLELENLRQYVNELEIVADMAAGLSTSQDCDPAHHGLVCAAVASLNYSENDKDLARRALDSE